MKNKAKPQKAVIAIDGHSGCGKSTLAKSLAKKINYLYIDTGAMYRAITWYLLENKVDISDEEQVAQAIEPLAITFVKSETGNHVAVNGEDVEKYIRSMEVSKSVSPVAELKVVRDKLVALQRQIGQDGGVVMDGRDIGTVVFPDADLKIFLTADVETRVARRVAEYLEKGQTISYDAVKENLTLRDHIDSTREISPLRQAEDAVVIDNSHLTKVEQLEQVVGLLRERGFTV